LIVVLAAPTLAMPRKDYRILRQVGKQDRHHAPLAHPQLRQASSEAVNLGAEVTVTELASAGGIDQRRPVEVICSTREHERRQFLVGDERLREPTTEDHRYPS
jgi:hypothetical protein